MNPGRPSENLPTQHQRRRLCHRREDHRRQEVHVRRNGPGRLLLGRQIRKQAKSWWNNFASSFHWKILWILRQKLPQADRSLRRHQGHHPDVAWELECQRPEVVLRLVPRIRSHLGRTGLNFINQFYDANYKKLDTLNSKDKYTNWTNGAAFHDFRHSNWLLWNISSRSFRPTSLSTRSFSPAPHLMTTTTTSTTATNLTPKPKLKPNHMATVPEIWPLRQSFFFWLLFSSTKSFTEFCL